MSTDNSQTDGRRLHIMSVVIIRPTVGTVWFQVQSNFRHPVFTVNSTALLRVSSEMIENFPQQPTITFSIQHELLNVRSALQFLCLKLNHKLRCNKKKGIANAKISARQQLVYRTQLTKSPLTCILHSHNTTNIGSPQKRSSAEFSDSSSRSSKVIDFDANRKRI